MKFNKVHCMFCTIYRFVHRYEITERVSKESNEAFNGALANIKTRLRCMPTLATRFEVTNACTQSNLNGNIMQEKIVLKTGITGKKRCLWKSVTRGEAYNMTVASMG